MERSCEMNSLESNVTLNYVDPMKDEYLRAFNQTNFLQLFLFKSVKTPKEKEE